MIIFKYIYQFYEIVWKGFNKVILVPGIKASLGSCGKNVKIAYNCDFKPISNIYIGDNTQIGPHSLFWSTRAKIKIGNNVLFGPNVTIITGDHRTDIVGKHINEVSDYEKLTENDADVVIEDGVWIGSNVTILKGVKVGEGCILASGTIVTKDTMSYGVYGGIPAKKIRDRFTVEQLIEHKKLLSMRNKT